MFRNSLLKISRSGIQFRTFTSSSLILSQTQQKAPALLNITPELLVLKVGLIKECQKHPEADKLYVSKIITAPESADQDATSLTVCSGLVDHVPIDQMINKKIVLLTNLKPSKMRGIKSEAMILAAEMKKTVMEDGESTTKVEVEVVNAPSSSQIGDSLIFKPFFNNLQSSNNTPRLKSKNWEVLQSRLFTDDSGTVIYKDSEDGKCYKLTDEKEDAAFVERLKGAIVR
ncbi:hypothetical protein WICPIJ_003715 [Wickerhamomyces pijperi]|uniref:tRNA-binding domain-containing protein n=1 Tax=Wickerhamomyces pijperi TaxID=599730 RepID=A0A9P8Q739_WICPI|nr:hypothetical protein WICPIJ_003715 [Wickerhamomyces pijperi]